MAYFNLGNFLSSREICYKYDPNLTANPFYVFPVFYNLVFLNKPTV